MKRQKRQNKGVLTVEATISYTIFMMVILTILFLMRIVYAYALVQHAVSQTAKELSMYTYLYHVSGVGDTVGELQSGTQSGEEKFNADAESVVKIYETLADGWDQGDAETVAGEGQKLTLNPKKILQNVGSAIVGNASRELVNQSFSEISRWMMAGYIAADSDGADADVKLKNLQVINGLKGLDFSASRFFEDGQTIDIVVCYTLDPILPIDLMPKMNLMNRASVRGMSGSSMFEDFPSGTTGKKEEEKSVWDILDDTERGKEIQKQQGVRNLPDNFSTFSAFYEETGKAVAELSMDLREDSYQTGSGIRSALRRKCNKIENYRTSTMQGYTVKAEDIRSRELIVYIPASVEGRSIDRSLFDAEIKKLKEEYPDIAIMVKELK